ncbi:MAG: hypothetical protein IKT40_12420 [Bacilli bacterium]|nr:hypothetical protein [Bacilli bacterium]
MEKICLQSCYHKKDAEILCQKNNTTIKEVVLDNINDIIIALQNISKKIENNERAINEDWVKAAYPMNSIMNALGNAWYLDDEKE